MTLLLLLLSLLLLLPLLLLFAQFPLPMRRVALSMLKSGCCAANFYLGCLVALIRDVKLYRKSQHK